MSDEYRLLPLLLVNTELGYKNLAEGRHHTLDMGQRKQAGSELEASSCWLVVLIVPEGVVS